MHFLEMENISKKILDELLKYRRYFTDSIQFIDEEIVSKVQLPRIRAFVDQGAKIVFILPAFPFKSPNPKKVIGKKPDMGERLSLVFLNDLCRKIQCIYSPGAEIIICSDGHVFCDLICVDDDSVNNYQIEMANLLRELNLSHLSLFNLYDSDLLEIHAFGDYEKLRELLIEFYGRPIDDIRCELKETESGISLYRAITRFLYEDSLLPDHTDSKTALQKRARQLAVAVIQRSQAWGELLSASFPTAIRLSIHPQPAESLKIGIHMMPTKDNWLTPWHGVAVNINGQFTLMKNETAQKMNGKLIDVFGQPSHYEIEIA
ncbi:L-tyrosine/L-tryptophan isonitrile synthase family protein [Providencia rettgeri]|nr:isocyanide synthase family protein [Providencia rettgeri]